MSTDFAAALFPRARRAILGLLLDGPEDARYLREIAVKTRLGVGQVQRELARLVAGGVLTRRKRGMHVWFQANPDCPVFQELRALVRKTVGVVALLREALAPLADRIDVAFLYGSVARGEETARSDVDVMVLGDVGFGDVVEALRPVERSVGRAVNPSVFRLTEARERIAAGRHFLSAVVASPCILLAGDERVLDGLRAQRLAPPARADA